MTLVDSAGKPIGDLAPKTKQVTLDIAAITQRAGIARSHPLDSQRTATKNLLIEDVENLLGAITGLGKQYEWLSERHSALVGNANNSNVLLALILDEVPEWRWSKAAVEAFTPVGGWVLEDDPADPDGWLLRMSIPEPTMSAEEQTGSDPGDPLVEDHDEIYGGVEPREPALDNVVSLDEHRQPVDGDQHDGGAVPG